MDELAGIFFHVNAGDADALGLAVDFDFKMAVCGDGQLVLGNLIAFWQIRVEIVLAGEPARFFYGAMGGQRHFNGVVHHFSVQHRQYAGHAQAHGTGVGVGRRAKSGRTAAENFGLGFELGVDFESDDGGEFHG